MSRGGGARRRATALALALGALGADAPAAEITRRVGAVTVRVETQHAFPGGVVSVRLTTRRRLGSTWALLDGRRAPFYAGPGGLRALVPVAADSAAGPATLGIGIAARRGEQRIAIPVEIAAHPYASRTALLPTAVHLLFDRPEAHRDARRLLVHLRAESAATPPGPLRPPVEGTGRGFGELRSHPALRGLESRIDGLGGERQRGLVYAVPLGTKVRAPGAGTVAFAGTLVLSGGTIVLDHGQGVVSVLQHLSRIDVRAGESVVAGRAIGLTGVTGAVAEPALQWRVYLHSVAVDPEVLAAVLAD